MNKQQLANKIWASANKMRSKIEANEYKDYILGLIFYKFLSDNEVNYLRSIGWTDEDLETLVEDYEDKEAVMMMDYCKNNIGYFIEYKYLFGTWLLPNVDFSIADLSAALNNFDRLVSPNYKHVYSNIFKTLQTGLSKLGENPAAQTRAIKDLIKLIKDIPTDGSQDYDVLGYVYEYLISNFAANAGKKAGEFYTPHEVAILMSEIVAEHHKNKEHIEIYDPTSGSGSLLITIGKSIGRHIEDKNKVKYYAQELKENTYNLTRMNLVMRGIRPDNINTRCADSLEEDWPIQLQGSEIGRPLYVDAVVSNPPYSQQWSPVDRELDARFKDYGVAPKSKADYAFLLHELHHLKPNGILTIVLPHGVLFRGDANEDSEGEGKIRRNLIEHNNIDAIIGLPANIFFGTSIPTLVMVLKQHRDNDDVLIIDASKGFVKEGKNNKLRASDIRRIADTVRDRKTVPGFSRTVSRKEIRDNGYNLNIPRYVDSNEPVEKFDIYATMFGGIPNSEIDELQTYWDALPSLCNDLFAPEDGKPYSNLKSEDIEGVINANADVKAFQERFNAAFDGFEALLHQRLIDNVMSLHPMKELDAITENMFARLDNIPLIDKYATYQALADNWQMITNDVETIQQEGIDAVRVVEPAYKVVKKGDEEIEVPDGLKGRIIPFELVQRIKFQSELDEIVALQNRVEEINGEVDEIRDSFTEEESEKYLDAEKDNAYNKKEITAGAKAKGDDVEPETKVKLKGIVKLWDEQKAKNKNIKGKKQELIEKIVDAIENLSDEEVVMFLDEKWIKPIIQGYLSSLKTVLFSLKFRLSELYKKYKNGLKQINESIDVISTELSSYSKDLFGENYSIKGLNELLNFDFVFDSFFPKEGEKIPKIRFKGFDGIWSNDIAGNIFQTFNEKNMKGLPVLSATQDKGMVVRESIGFNVYHDISNETTYKHILPGQFVIHLRSFQGGFAHSAIEGIASPAYTVLEFKNPNTQCDLYWKYVFTSKAFIKRLELITYGIRDGRSINLEEFKHMNFTFPSLEEQRKIASYLQAFDLYMSFYAQKLEKLKHIQLACLDKMFV